MTRITRPHPSGVDTALAAEFARMLSALEGSGAPEEIVALARQLDAAIQANLGEEGAACAAQDQVQPR